MCDLGPVTVLPLATGMALTMTLLALPSIAAGGDGMGDGDRSGAGAGGGDRGGGRRRVLWSRIDQKTCLKAITAAGLEPVVIELLKQGDELVTDVEVCLLNYRSPILCIQCKKIRSLPPVRFGDPAQGIRLKLEELGDSVACVVTTTSCFAPRAPDNVVAVAKLCQVIQIEAAEQPTLVPHRPTLSSSLPVPGCRCAACDQQRLWGSERCHLRPDHLCMAQRCGEIVT